MPPKQCKWFLTELKSYHTFVCYVSFKLTLGYDNYHEGSYHNQKVARRRIVKKGKDF